MNSENGTRGQISVVLVDDHEVLRTGLKLILEREPNIKVVGEAGDGQVGVRVVNRCKPDVVIMDLNMPVLSGMEATRQILKSVPNTKVLILTAYDTDGTVGLCMEYGVAGFLLKSATAVDVIKGVQEVAKGNGFFSPEIAKRIRDVSRASLDNPGSSLTYSGLTSREMEVLQLIAEGASNKQIAGHLNISIKTVEKHRQQVMNKLNIHDIAGLSRYYNSIFGADFGNVRLAASDGNKDPLSLDEKVILVHLARGKKYEDIAAELEITADEVRMARTAIAGKLRISSDAELAAYAESKGLIETNRRKK